MCKSATTSIVAWILAAIIGIYVITRGKPFDKQAGFFILVFTLVQLIEFFIWSDRKNQGLSANADQALKANAAGDPNNTNDSSSEGLTRLIVIALWLQPLAQTYLAYRYGRTIKGPLLVMTVAYFIMFIWSITYAFDSKNKFSSQPYLGDLSVVSTYIDETGNKFPKFSVEATLAESIAFVTGKYTECDASGKPSGGHLKWNVNNKNGMVGGGLAGGLYLFGLLFGLLCMDPKLYGWILIGLALLLIFYTKSMHAGAEFSSMWCLYSVIWCFMVLLLSFSTRKSL